MMNIQQDYSLLPHNTFGLSVCCDYFAEYNSINSLLEILGSDLFPKYPFLQIGSGSNLLFTKKFEGIILHSCICEITIVSEDEDSVVVEVGSGVIWDDFVDYCVTRNWGGVENLSLIPGEVGASSVQNIGAYGVEVKDVIEYVKAIHVDTKELRIFSNNDCCYAYRESIFKNLWRGQYIVTSVAYRLKKKPQFNIQYGNIQDALARFDTITLQNIRQAIIQIRNEKLPDPVLLGNAGSFFMNPVIETEKYEKLLLNYPDMPHYKVGENKVKLPAAWLIEKSGCKACRVGNAAVHDKQCLVLINAGGATASDIVQLSHMIQQAVKEKFEIQITPEVNFIV